MCYESTGPLCSLVALHQLRVNKESIAALDSKPTTDDLKSLKDAEDNFDESLYGQFLLREKINSDISENEKTLLTLTLKNARLRSELKLAKHRATHSQVTLLHDVEHNHSIMKPDEVESALDNNEFSFAYYYGDVRRSHGEVEIVEVVSKEGQGAYKIKLPSGFFLGVNGEDLVLQDIHDNELGTFK